MSRYVKSVAAVILALGILVAIANFFGSPPPCQEVLTYSLGDFDSRFGISREKLLETLVQAESVWEKPTGLDLFAYSPEAVVTVNLIYDERQEQTQAEYELRKKLDASGSSYDSLVAEHTALLKTYEQDRALYESRLAAYNSQLAHWNGRGGAPKKEYDELAAERAYLQNEQDRLNGIARQLNSLAERITAIAKEYNLSVSVYNQRFAISRQFDQADYRSGDKTINVYQFGDIDELRLGLAHELGHALGLEHVEDPEAIMYYLMERQNQQRPALTDNDVSALKKLCDL